MGGGPSKEELEKLENERDNKLANQTAELERLKQKHADGASKREQELRERNRAVADLKSKLSENIEAYEAEVKRRLQEQKEAAEQLEMERAAQLESVRNDGEDAKLRISNDYDKKAAHLREQHKAVMEEAVRKREMDRKKRDADIAKAESERDEVVKKQAKEEEQLKKDIEQKNRQHRKDVDKHFDDMKKEIENYTRIAIDRATELAQANIAIADRQYAIVRSEAVRATLEGFYNEYKFVKNEMKKLKSTSDNLSITMGNVNRDEFAIYEVKSLTSDLKCGTEVIDHYQDSLKHRMKMCLDAPDNIRRALEAPLQSYQQSCDDAKEVYAELEYACRNKDLQSIGEMRAKIDQQKLILKNVIDKMDKIDASTDLKAAVENIIRKSITN